MWKSKQRAFPLDIPEYLLLRMGEGQTSWTFRSEYERAQAKRLIQHKVDFRYEYVPIFYDAKVHQGVCLDCGSTDVRSSRKYTCDFYFPDTEIFVELKGKFDSQNRTMMALVTKDCEEDIRMVFLKDNYLTRKKKMSYSRWCELNGIKYAIGDIPLEWCRT